MPCKTKGGYSKKTISHNIGKLIRGGLPPSQAVAASYARAKQSAKKAGKRPAHLRKK